MQNSCGSDNKNCYRMDKHTHNLAGNQTVVALKEKNNVDTSKSKEIIGISRWVSTGELFIVFKTKGNTICWTPPDWKLLTLVDILEAFANLSPEGE